MEISSADEFLVLVRRPFAFHGSARGLGGDFLHASTPQLQRWFGLQRNRPFPDLVPFARVRSSDRGRKRRLSGLSSVSDTGPSDWQFLSLTGGDDIR
jgi:hypothetical protein